MKKEELLGIYQREASRFAFKPTEDKPYLIEPQPDVFSKLIQGGFLNEKPVNLVIEETGVNEESILDAAVGYDLVANCYNQRADADIFVGDCIARIPNLIGSVWVDTVNHRYISRVMERPVAKRSIPMELFAGGLDLSQESTRELVRKTAQICYDTERLLADPNFQNSISHVIPPINSSAEYFLKRFQKWHQIRKEQGEGINNTWGLIKFKCPREKLLVKFLEAVDLDSIEMSYGFNVFANTDLIETEDHRFYVLDARVEPKPYGFLIAAWLWNYVLYSWNCSPEQVFEAVMTCLKIFYRVYEADSKLRASVKYNMFERLYATLEIDLRYKRSPYNQLGEQEFRSTIQNVSELLNRMF